MGLDMYIQAKRYVQHWEFDTHNPEMVDRANLANAINAIMPDPPGFELTELTYNAVYWRKANAIHQWFVTNVQEGVDECQETFVSVENLQRLYDLCTELMKDRDLDKAKELLPTESGFFFGSTEYDDEYWQDVEDTAYHLERLLKIDQDNPGTFNFYYQASW